MEVKKHSRPPKNKNKESHSSIINSNSSTTSVNNINNNNSAKTASKSVKTPPAGYLKCKHKQCNVYCENEDTQRRHMEDFKYHRHHFKKLGDDCNQCSDLANKPLWRRIIELRGLIALSRDLLQLVETTRDTPPVLDQ